MINISMNSGAPIDRQSISSLNNKKVQGAQTRQTISSINRNTGNGCSFGNASANHTPTSGSSYNNSSSSATPTPPAPSNKPTPPLLRMVQKGQKVPLTGITAQSKVKVCLGWNTTNGMCDVDVSAFLLNATGRVIGDDWFVFYGQTTSPDNSTAFFMDNGADREYITIDFARLNPNVTKIVFVLTINEALEKNLNFSMLKDAYIRILDSGTNQEYSSFKMTDYYSNVTSMMIGEIYLHNNSWKFNAIGNGVARDLAGLCDLYGVQTI